MRRDRNFTGKQKYLYYLVIVTNNEKDNETRYEEVNGIYASWLRTSDRMIKILHLSGVYLLSFNRKGLNGWNYYKIIDTSSTEFYAYERYRLNDRE